MADYKWTYASIGGSTRVKIQSGEDIRHLGELDEKMWTVLSCPTVGLEIDETSLKLIDTDNDGKLHVQEVIKTANWLCATLTNPDILLKGEAQLNVADIADESIRVVAEKIATDGVITLDAVRAAIGAVTVEAQAVPEAPYSGEVTAAYKACKDAYAQYFATARMQALGLATLPADAAVPGMTEEAFGEMGKKIADYEAEKAAIEGANAKLLADAQSQYRPLEKLLLLTRDFYALLRNYVSFQDFYAKRGKALLGRAAKGETPWAIFQAGTLVIDQRACNLCLRVNDAAKHNAQAPASGMFLVYCNCTYKPTGQTMQIVAAVTVGDIKNLKVGKNALFYDRQGRDWDAEVTKIIDNPISIGQAFWSPYRKLGDWIVNLINKSAAEKEAKSFNNMTANIQKDMAAKPADGASPEKMQAFDIAKFAGIFAAIGMALGFIGSFLTSLAKGVAALTWWQLILSIIAILLVVSGPSMVLAWLKLRQRNLAPLLNANGWAINADAIVNAMFGSSLTEQAQFPMMKLVDPYAPVKKISAGGKWAIAISVIVAVVAIVALVLWLMGYQVCFCFHM
ncbi:MAG: hypothetical protein J6R43_00825 [Paludibacteraceae bacterium]|nr:hypothetical protein [Paludibacteraceae bacterium]